MRGGFAVVYPDEPCGYVARLVDRDDGLMPLQRRLHAQVVPNGRVDDEVIDGRRSDARGSRLPVPGIRYQQQAE